MDKNYDVIAFILNTLILRRPGVVVFADIFKIVTITKDSRKVKRIRNYL